MKKTRSIGLIFSSLTIAMATAFVACGSARGDTVGYTEGGTETNSGGGYGGGGFDFTVTTSIQVTQLGFFALSIGGGDTPHVFLWDVTTSSLIGDTGSLQGLLTNGQWNYFSLGTPVTLNPGDVYQVSAPVYFTPTYNSSLSFTYGPEIVSAGFVNKGSGFGGWTQASPYTNPVLLDVPTTANFQYTAAAVPEPSSVALLLVGCGVGAVGLLRKRCVAA